MAACRCFDCSIRAGAQVRRSVPLNRDRGRLRSDSRNQFFPRRLAWRFENRPILESQTDSAGQKILLPHALNGPTLTVTKLDHLDGMSC
jgi:hypothetical protein